MTSQSLVLPSPALAFSLPGWPRVDRSQETAVAHMERCRAAAPANDHHAASGDIEALLLSRIARGDEAALADLYDRLSGVTLAVLTRIVGSAGDAEEVLQEVFLQVWRQAPTYDANRASARSWVLLLARSRGLDRLKSAAARRRREEEVTRQDGVVVPPRGSARLEQQERSRQVREALASLPAEQRRAVELAFFDGLTHVEISAHLGEPLGTIKSRILLGLRKLRLALGEAA